MLWLYKNLGGKRFINFYKQLDDFFYQLHVSVYILMIFTGDIYFSSAFEN